LLKKNLSDRGYVAQNFKVEYLGKFKAIFKNILGGYSGALGWLNHEKN